MLFPLTTTYPVRPPSVAGARKSQKVVPGGKKPDPDGVSEIPGQFQEIAASLHHLHQLHVFQPLYAAFHLRSHHPHFHLLSS